MDDRDASGSVIAWSWVIEALASSRDVDLGILYDLIGGTPGLSDNLGKEAREMVSLRCLEALCDPAKVINSGDVSSSSGQEEIQCDCSKCFCCVLQRVLDQASVSGLRKCGSDPFVNLRKGASGNLMRELNALMERRKGSLPKCALEKLKDRLQDGDNFHQKSLKRDRRCLQTQKRMQDCPVDVSDKSPPGKKLRHDSNGSIPSTEQNLDPLISSNTNPLDALSGKLAQSMRLLTWRPSDVSNEDEKRHAECSSTPADSTELDVCIKCNKGGEVLICSISSCPIVVHERCLGFSESIDNRDDFLCPFCDYSSAQSEYAEAKRKWVLSREKLSLFVGGNPDHHPEVFANVNANPPRQGRDGGLFKGKGFYPANQASTGEQHKSHSVQGNIHTSPPKCSSEEKGEDITAEKCRLDKGKQIMPIEHFHYDGLRGGFVEVKPLREICSRSKNGSFASSGSLNGTPETKNYTANPSDNHVSLQSLPKVADQMKRASGPFFDDFDGTVVKENFTAPTFKYFPRCKGRIRVPWTEEEVEMLKEGMKRFGSGDVKIIPWKIILEFGSSVFSKCRTTVDLKDKWRNLSKANPERK